MVYIDQELHVGISNGHEFSYTSLKKCDNSVSVNNVQNIPTGYVAKCVRGLHGAADTSFHTQQNNDYREFKIMLHTVTVILD